MTGGRKREKRRRRERDKQEEKEKEGDRDIRSEGELMAKVQVKTFGEQMNL
jgi:hypothetical protein